MKKLVALLCEEMNSKSMVKRNLLLSWLDLLYSIPNVGLLNRVPDLLTKLIAYFADPDEEIRIKTQNLLGELLSEFKTLGERRGAQTDERVLETLVKCCKYDEFHVSVLCRSVTMLWIQNFLSFLLQDVKHEPGVLFGRVTSCVVMWDAVYPELVEQALGLINDPSAEVQVAAAYINDILQKLVVYVIKDKRSLDVLVSIIMERLKKDSVNNIDVIMDWLILLMKEQPDSLEGVAKDALKEAIKLLPELAGSVNWRVSIETKQGAASSWTDVSVLRRLLRGGVERAGAGVRKNKGNAWQGQNCVHRPL